MQHLLKVVNMANLQFTVNSRLRITIKYTSSNLLKECLSPILPKTLSFFRHIDFTFDDKENMALVFNK